MNPWNPAANRHAPGTRAVQGTPAGRGTARANRRKARDAARIPTATGRSRRITPTIVSTTRLRDLARSSLAWPAASIDSSCSRRCRLRGCWLGIVEAQAADRASETANPTTTSGPVNTPSTS